MGNFEKHSEAFNGFFQIYKLNDNLSLEIDDLVTYVSNFIKEIKNGLSYVMEFEIDLELLNAKGQNFDMNWKVNRDAIGGKFLFPSGNLDRNTNKRIRDMIDEIQGDFDNGPSGLTKERINAFYILLYPNYLKKMSKQVIGDSLFGKKYKKLPEVVENSNYVINIRNADNKCFFWCLVAHFLSQI